MALATLIEAVPDLIFVKDVDGKYVTCNAAFAAFVQRSKSEIIGTTDFDLVPCESARRFVEVDQAIVRLGHSQENDEWVTGPDRRPTLFHTIKTPCYAPDGTVLGVLGVSRDITARHRAETRLHESERLFRTLVEAAPEAIFVRTGEHFAYVNRATVRMFGAQSADELLGQRVLDRFHPDCREAALARMRHMDTVHEATTEVDRVFLRLDGVPVDVNVSAVSIAFEGQPSSLVFARDITDRKRVEASMRHELFLQQQLARIAATVPGTIYSFLMRPDGSTAMPFASAAIEPLFGFTADQVRNDASGIMQLVHPDDAARVNAAILESARTLQPWREEFRAVNTPKGEIWIEGHSVPQRQPDGSVLWFGFLQDVTERKTSERLVRKLSRAVEQSPVSIVITDDEGRIEYVNPKFSQLTGYTLDEVRGESPRILKTGSTPPDEYARLWKTIRGGDTWHGEFCNRKRDGGTFWELATISPITDDNGRITNFLAVKEDVTERRDLEARLRQSQKLEAIGQLAGGVAHDFNNILAALMMQTELLMSEERLSDDVREGLAEIKETTERAASLTRQLLLFSRRQVLQPRDLDLNDVVVQLSRMLQRLIREDIRLDLRLDPRPVMTHADAGMLDQVLMNLAVNARDAMTAGGTLTIETSVCEVDAAAARQHPDGAPGHYACLRVTDTGCGMPPEIMAHMFEPFFTTKRPGQGTGLGLATVFGVVKQHKGWIAVDSSPGTGTRFEVFLPLASSVTGARSQAAASLSRGGTETLLLVEDDAAVRRGTRAVLAQQGYTVLEADCGADALRVWTEHTRDVSLLVTDLVMPGEMNGRDLALAIRAERPELPVVFTSGYSAEIAGTEIHVRSGDAFVQKPASPAHLLEVIRQVLDGALPSRAPFGYTVTSQGGPAAQ
ncbi:MAG: histidine kinase [Acidimicrobiia bacterium]